MSFSRKTFTSIFGDLNSEFNVYTIEDIASDKKRSIISGPFGSNISSKYFTESGVPVIRGNNLTEDNTRFIDDGFVFVSQEKADELNTYANVDDLIFTAAGTIGQVGMIPENSKFKKYVISNKQLRVTLDLDNVNQHYVYYWFSSKLINKYIKQLNTGSTIPLINLSIIKGLPIPLPSKEIQDKIANIILNIDKKIQLDKEINRNLQNLIKILYKEYFESFELDNVPDDWELVNIGSIIDIYNGYSYKGAELQESDCGMVTIKNFNRDGSFRIDGFKEIVYSNKIKKHHFINENDVLISCTDVTQDADIIGNCIMVLDKQNYDELIMSMDLVKIESKIPEINNFLLASIFKSYNFKKHILGYVNGTTVLHLDKKGIKKFKIALPKDLSELKNISERFELIYAEIQCNQKEINKLTNLRDTLLPKLMSGEIDVSQIDM